jgi:hypothetical protein
MVPLDLGGPASRSPERPGRRRHHRDPIERRVFTALF